MFFRDIDVAVYVYPLNDPLDYEFEIERELSDKLCYPVDVTILNEAPPWFALIVFHKLFKKTLDE